MHYTIEYFVRNYINNSNIVKSNNLDYIESTKEVVDYLNILRVIYYLKCLKYYNINRYQYNISKFL